MRNKKGFTLIELVIVMALMVIVSNAASLSLSSADRQTMNQACIQLKSNLRYAQRLAITENRRYTVSFDIVKNEYVIYYKEGAANRLVKRVQMSDGVRLQSTTSGTNAVTYTGMGATGDPCTITMENAAYMAQLTVNLGVGRVKITAFKRI